LIYLFVWETTFHRKVTEVRPGGEVSPGGVSSSSDFELTQRVNDKAFELTQRVNDKAFEGDSKKGVEVTQVENISPISPISTNLESQMPERKLTFRQQLKVFRGRITERSLLQAFIQPFPLLLFPSVVFATFVNGAFVTWLQMSGLLK
jgi:hypothetical protein